MNKKLNSLSDLAKIKFKGLVPDQEETLILILSYPALKPISVKKAEPERSSP